MYGDPVQEFGLLVQFVYQSLDGRPLTFFSICRADHILLPKMDENIYPNLRLYQLEVYINAIC
jgi:hypothetical protein